MAQHLKKRTSGHNKLIAAGCVMLMFTGAAVGIMHFGETQILSGSLPPSKEEYVVSSPLDMTRAQALCTLNDLAPDNVDIEYILDHEGELSTLYLCAAANNPEKAKFVRGSIDEGYAAAAVMLPTDAAREHCPLLLQWDSRWAYTPYGSDVIGMTGCGPTCMSMVITALTDAQDATPDKLARWAEEEGYYVSGAGTSWSYIQAQSEEYDLSASELPLWEASMTQALDRGALIVCSMKEGDFTTDGHYIVIVGYDEDGFIVNDPNCIYRSGCRWSYEQLQGQISNLWAVE